MAPAEPFPSRECRQNGLPVPHTCKSAAELIESSQRPTRGWSYQPVYRHENSTTLGHLPKVTRLLLGESQPLSVALRHRHFNRAGKAGDLHEARDLGHKAWSPCSSAAGWLAPDEELEKRHAGLHPAPLSWLTSIWEGDNIAGRENSQGSIRKMSLLDKWEINAICQWGETLHQISFDRFLSGLRERGCRVSHMEPGIDNCTV